MDKLNILDRWIIAKTHVLIENSVTSMDQFRVDLFMRSFETFLEELSNWYIRRNRRRFWKSEDDQDKNSAQRPNDPATHLRRQDYSPSKIHLH